MELYKNALEILDYIIQDKLIRNIGVRVSDLVNYKSSQISLFEEFDEKDDTVQEILDKINNKYNDLKIMPAIFYEKSNHDDK